MSDDVVNININHYHSRNIIEKRTKSTKRKVTLTKPKGNFHTAVSFFSMNLPKYSKVRVRKYIKLHGESREYIQHIIYILLYNIKMKSY